MPDTIDPERTNASLPPSQQRVPAVGADDPIASRSLLQANVLCRSGRLAPHVDCEQAVVRALEFAKVVSAGREVVREFEKDENDQVAKFDAQPGKGSSLRLPVMADVEGRCNKFVQCCSHGTGQLKAVVQNFYPDIKSKWRDRLEEKASDSGDENFKNMAAEVNRFLTFLQNVRNAIEHPGPGNTVHFSDFRLTAEGRVVRPSFSLDHAQTPQPEVPVVVFMKRVEDSLLESFELLLAHLCNAHCQDFGKMPVWVEEMPENWRRNKHVKYGYVTRLGDQIVPFG